MISEPSHLDQEVRDLKHLVSVIAKGKYMWESTFDAITDPVIIVSEKFEIERANRAAAEQANLDVRKLPQKKCYKTLAGSNASCQSCPVAQVFQTGEHAKVELEPFVKGERQFVVHAYPLKTKNSQGHRQMVMYYRDITDEKKLHRQLLKSEKMASIGVLAGGVAHEINNPLGGILAFAQLAMRELDSKHAAYNDLVEIEQAALRCKRIVQDLLEYSRQNPEAEMSHFKLSDLIKKSLPLVKIQARAAKVKLSLDLDSELPLIKGNWGKLQQVILNLVSNACQAMEKGGDLSFKIYFENASNKICLEIKDTGPGIQEDLMNKIFDPFFTTKELGQGTGLGLAISYSIMKEHGGDIEVLNGSVKNRNKGAIFILKFPT